MTPGNRIAIGVSLIFAGLGAMGVVLGRINAKLRYEARPQR